MKTINRLILCLLLLAMAVAVGLAAETFTNPNADFTARAGVAAVAPQGGVPPGVLDSNFREWQPPQPVPEYLNPNVPDAAITTMGPQGMIIVYNPNIMGQLPPKFRAFVRAHEYGHVYYGGNEIVADQFAAEVYRQTDPGVCSAAAWYLYVMNNPGDATHPPSRYRAQVVAQTCGVSF